MNGKAAELVISEAVCFFTRTGIPYHEKDNISTPALYINIYKLQNKKASGNFRRLFFISTARVVISAEQSFLLQNVWD